jgi:hypothetical protein
LHIIKQQEPPTAAQTHNLMEILKGSNTAVTNNVVVLLFNLVYDHSQWRDQLVSEHAFIDYLVGLFELHNLSEFFMINLLKTIYKTVHKAPAHSSFLKLN